MELEEAKLRKEACFFLLGAPLDSDESRVPLGTRGLLAILRPLALCWDWDWDMIEESVRLKDRHDDTLWASPPLECEDDVNGSKLP